MDYKLYCKQIRKEFSKQGWTLLIYYGIMNVAVLLCTMIDYVLQLVDLIVDKGMDAAMYYADDLVTEIVMGNGWGYFLASAAGFLILLLWKGRKFTFGEIWTRGKPMTVRDFFPILGIFICAQVIFQLFSFILEAILNLFGLSAMAAIEAASMGMDTLSMFLYAGLLAPIAEEILFRGLILRSLMPFGKKVAIFVSALLFGLFHGNVVQSPFAFAVGLVLGYVAAEYSVAWAMVLHMFNNLILSDMLTRIISRMPALAGNLLSVVVVYGLSLMGIIFAIIRRKNIAAYLRRERMNGLYLKCCFTAPGIIVLAVLMIINMLVSITPL